MTEDPYRGEGERLRRRVAELEEELSEAQAELQALRGRDGPSTTAERLFGGPLRVNEELALDGEVPAAAHEELAHRLRTRLGGNGHPRSVGSSFMWLAVNPHASRQVDVTVRARGGRTTLLVAERLGNLRGQLFGGLLALGLVGLAIFLPLFVHLAGLRPFALPATVGGLTAVLLAARAAYGSAARGRQREGRRILDELRSVCEQHLAAANERARIAERSDDREGHVDDEAVAEAEAASPTGASLGTRLVG